MSDILKTRSKTYEVRTILQYGISDIVKRFLKYEFDVIKKNKKCDVSTRSWLSKSSSQQGSRWTLFQKSHHSNYSVRFFPCSRRGFPKFINIYAVDIFDDDISFVHTGRVTVSCHWEAVYGVGLHLREDSCVWLDRLPRQLSALLRSYNFFRLNAP